MLDKPLEQIGIADLQQLIADNVQEGKAIDYKRVMYRLDSRKSLDSPKTDDKDVQREEFLKDVSSFANTIGGHLIIGMAEEKSIPTDILGVPLENHETEILRLHELIDQWIEPRISCSIYAVETEPGKYVLVVRVPQSLVSPHRVVYQNRFGQFWARNSKGAYAMDTSELRRAFTLSETLFEQIKEFRRERTRLVLNGETPVQIADGAALILHLIPLDSFAARLDFSVDILKRNSSHIFALKALGRAQRVNIDGIVISPGGGTIQSGYTQIFRNGVIEAVLGNITKPINNGQGMLLTIGIIQTALLNSLGEYLQPFQGLGIRPPVWCFLTLTRVKGAGIQSDADFEEKLPIDRDNLYLPEVLLDDLSVNITKVLRPLFDMIWNAAGWEKSWNVTPDGRRA
jgi:hypothetical protein